MVQLTLIPYYTYIYIMTDYYQKQYDEKYSEFIDPIKKLYLAKNQMFINS